MVSNAEMTFKSQFTQLLTKSGSSGEATFFKLAKARSLQVGSKAFRKRWMQCVGRPFSMTPEAIMAAIAPLAVLKTPDTEDLLEDLLGR